MFVDHQSPQAPLTSWELHTFLLSEHINGFWGGEIMKVKLAHNKVFA